MPIYVYRCSAGHKFDRYLRIADLDTPQACECGAEAARQVCAPAVHADLPGYVSPATGKWVEGRRAREDDLKRSGCIAWEPGIEKDVARNKADHERRFEEKLDVVVEQTYSELNA